MLIDLIRVHVLPLFSIGFMYPAAKSFYDVHVMVIKAIQMALLHEWNSETDRKPSCHKNCKQNGRLFHGSIIEDGSIWCLLFLFFCTRFQLVPLPGLVLWKSKNEIFRSPTYLFIPLLKI